MNHPAAPAPEFAIDRLEDLVAIEDLLVHFAFLIDTRQFDRVAGEVFTEDGTLDYGTGEIVGRVAVTRFFDEFPDDVSATSHVISNLQIDIEGDHAVCRCYIVDWHWLSRPEDDAAVPASFAICGGCYDLAERTSDGWRVSLHRALRHGVAAGTASPGLGEIMRSLPPATLPW